MEFNQHHSYPHPIVGVILSTPAWILGLFKFTMGIVLSDWALIASICSGFAGTGVFIITGILKWRNRNKKSD